MDSAEFRAVRVRFERRWVMHPAMENLAEDHRTIQRVVDAMHTTAHRLLANRPVDSDALRQSVAFLEGFLEHCHYRKEEEFLFPALTAAHAFIADRPIAELAADHERSRRHFGELKRALRRLDEDGRTAEWDAAVALTRYHTTLSQHIHEEERTCFPYADRSLDPEELNLLMLHFANLEAGLDGKPELHELYEAVAEDVVAALAADEEAVAVSAAV